MCAARLTLGGLDRFPTAPAMFGPAARERQDLLARGARAALRGARRLLTAAAAAIAAAGRAADLTVARAGIAAGPSC